LTPFDSAGSRRAQARPGGPRVAVVHDWLTGMRGGEKVLEAICELFPRAELYTLVRVPNTVSPALEARSIRSSAVDRLPAVGRFYRHLLPLFPAVVETFDLDRYDLVISSSHCAVKSVIRSGRAVHICYCHSPMRYAWDQFHAYFGPDQVGRVAHTLLRPVLAALARWDAATAGRVDVYVANSRYVAGRIRRYYNRGSTVVYPPVDTEFYRLPDSAVLQGQHRTSGAERPAPNRERRAPSAQRPGFLVVSALVPYKKIDVAIDACRAAGAPLKVVGSGPELARLQRRAGADVEFLGWRSNEEIRELYQWATAVLLPGVEDFGLVPVEAQACGCPVVALGAGGACETVVDGETGVLVPDGSVEALTAGLHRALKIQFDPAAIRNHALRFSRDRFKTDFSAVVEDALTSGAGGRGPGAGISGREYQPPSRPLDARGRQHQPPSSPQDVHGREYRPPSRTNK
jgi:glycosyltransferase involved in cell wall biosynthesis